VDIPAKDLDHYLYDVRNGAVVACALAKVYEASRTNRMVIAQQVIDSVKLMLNPNLGDSPTAAGTGSCYQALRELQCESSKAKVQTTTKMLTSKRAPASHVSNGLIFETTPEGQALLVELVNEMERIVALLKKTAGEELWTSK
jgi:hypothetical protein